MPMLEKILPKGTVLKGVRTEIYDGGHTFARQFGAYPLVIGLEGRFPLDKYYDVKITNHLLRSVTGIIQGASPAIWRKKSESSAAD